MTTDPNALSPAEVDARNVQASVLMKEGIRLLEDPGHDATVEALRCFDKALELRRGLPYENTPLLRYGLAACWLNRADALMRLGGPEAIADALHAYDEALAVAHHLPFDEDPKYLRRLVIALQNRGLALRAQEAPVVEVAAAFEAALAALQREEGAAIADRDYLMAAVWMNLANALAEDATADALPRAREAARQAIALVADLETGDADAAEVGVKARHVLCRTIARRLSQSGPGEPALAEDVHEATDAVDDALALARAWERQGVGRLRDIAGDLFRFGARVYQAYQPQFLEEFVLDNIDPSQSSPAFVDRLGIRIEEVPPDDQ